MTKRLSRRCIMSCGAVLAALVCASGAWAQVPYPNRAVKIIVGAPPGSATDVTARTVAQILSQALGQSFVVENQPGAGGIIATMQAVKAPPDGYTLLMSSSGSLAVNPTLYSHLPYDPSKDLEAVTMVNSMPMFLIANPAFPPDSVASVIKYAKADPSKVNYGSSGVGFTNHMTMEYFAQRSGVKLTHIPYKGGPLALSDLMGGQIQLMFEVASDVLPHAQSGKIKILGVSSAKRSPALPDVPTIAESGLPGFDATAWVGLVAPAHTPPEIIEKLNRAAVEGLHTPKVRAQFARLGVEVATNTPAEFDAFIKTEITKWGAVVRESGAKAD
jgi:tripartite-type tricarboxylate transporter receptor subunit TctC